MPTVRFGSNTADTFAGCSDCYIQEATPTATADNATLRTSHYGTTDAEVTLIQFSAIASAIPAGSTITAVSLSLYLEAAGGACTIDCRRLLRAFVESQATWNIAATAINWGTAGALNTTNDVAASSSANASPAATTGVRYTWSGAGLVADVQAIVDGTASNFGWRMDRTDGEGEFSVFRDWTSSTGTDGNRPFLEVTYTEGQPGGSDFGKQHPRGRGPYMQRLAFMQTPGAFPAPAGLSADYGLAEEVDTAFGLARVKIRAIGLAVETDAALPMGLRKARAAGLAAETDTAFAPARIKSRAFGRADETDTAFALGSTDTQAYGRADETDAALALGRIKSRAAGIALETDAALALAGRKARAAGVALETDAAFALGRRKSRTVQLAAETDTALAPGRSKARAAGVAAETDAALAMGRVKLRPYGLASEVDTAFALPPQGVMAQAYGLAVETDTAFAPPMEQIVVGVPFGMAGFGEFSGAIEARQRTEPKPRKPRLSRARSEPKQIELLPKPPQVAAFGAAVESSEALAMPGFYLYGGLMRTTPRVVPPKPPELIRSRCSHCGAKHHASPTKEP